MHENDHVSQLSHEVLTELSMKLMKNKIYKQQKKKKKKKKKKKSRKVLLPYTTTDFTSRVGKSYMYVPFTSHFSMGNAFCADSSQKLIHTFLVTTKLVQNFVKGSDFPPQYSRGNSKILVIRTVRNPNYLKKKKSSNFSSSKIFVAIISSTCNVNFKKKIIIKIA